MKICREIAPFREVVARFRADGESLGLVTTMGALHDGHLALVAAARAQCDRVAATIFVNPTQFGDPRDLETYPRDEARDLRLLDEAGADAVLLPAAAEVYPEGDDTFVETRRLASSFHGAVRPGHFRGVATVVAKLFNIVRPDRAYFGEKDYQQLAVIRRMTTDLHFGIDVVGVPTLREPDGLAMSSRNARLGPEDRAAAAILNRALDAGAALARPGVDAAEVKNAVRALVATEPRARLKGLDLVDPVSFEEVTGALDGPVGLIISAEFGGVLLIDQREIVP